MKIIKLFLSNIILLVIPYWIPSNIIAVENKLSNDIVNPNMVGTIDIYSNNYFSSIIYNDNELKKSFVEANDENFLIIRHNILLTIKLWIIFYGLSISLLQYLIWEFISNKILYTGIRYIFFEKRKKLENFSYENKTDKSFVNVNFNEIIDYFHEKIHNIDDYNIENKIFLGEDSVQDNIFNQLMVLIDNNFFDYRELFALGINKEIQRGKISVDEKYVFFQINNMDKQNADALIEILKNKELEKVLPKLPSIINISKNKAILHNKLLWGIMVFLTMIFIGFNGYFMKNFVNPYIKFQQNKIFIILVYGLIHGFILIFIIPLIISKNNPINLQNVFININIFIYIIYLILWILFVLYYIINRKYITYYAVNNSILNNIYHQYHKIYKKFIIIFKGSLMGLLFNIIINLILLLINKYLPEDKEFFNKQKYYSMNINSMNISILILINLILILINLKLWSKHFKILKNKILLSSLIIIYGVFHGISIFNIAYCFSAIYLLLPFIHWLLYILLTLIVLLIQWQNKLKLLKNHTNDNAHEEKIPINNIT